MQRTGQLLHGDQNIPSIMLGYTSGPQKSLQRDRVMQDFPIGFGSHVLLITSPEPAFAMILKLDLLGDLSPSPIDGRASMPVPRMKDLCKRTGIPYRSVSRNRSLCDRERSSCVLPAGEDLHLDEKGRR